MQSRRLPVVLAVTLMALAAAGAQDTPVFQVQYGPSGISSLQKPQDRYATDYIQSGHALGDVTIRYRTQNGAAWREVSAASWMVGTQGGATYSLQHAQPTLSGGAVVTASVRGPATRVVNTPFEPRTSSDIGAMRFTWAGKKGTEEWIEYDFDQPQSVESAEVFWAADAGRRLNTTLPAS